MNYIYYFTDYNDNIIYVGKTENIKKRMQTHFSRGHLDRECYDSVKHVFYAETGHGKYDNEIIETILIDKYKPLYNTEKVYIEQYEKLNFQVPDLKWKELFIIYENDGTVSVRFSNQRYPCFDTKLSDPERAQSIIDFNMKQIKYKNGIYKYYLPSLLNIYEASFLDAILKFYKQIKINTENSSFDEPISLDYYDSVYAAFYYSEDFDKTMFDILLRTNFIFQLEGKLYAVPLHTEAALKYINEKFVESQKGKAV